MLKRWRKRALEAGVILAVILGAQYWQTRGLPEGSAPPLAGTLLDGRSTSLEDTRKTAGGKPVLVVFWATWCPVCVAEEGNIEAVARDHPVLSVAMQSEDVARHMRTRGLSFPAIDDPEGRIASVWRVNGVPAHFVVDGAGKVRFRVVGYATEWGLRARLWWSRQFL